MLLFGGSGFLMAYSDKPVNLFFLYIHGGGAIAIYLAFYVAIFGVDAIKWMLINSAIGIFGIYSELRLILGLFDKEINDYSFARHAIPFSYYVLYTFLIYQAVLSFSGARENPSRKRAAEIAYIVISSTIYLTIYFNG